MHIKGGLRGQKGNPLDHTDEGVFISKINSGGAAKRDGRLKVIIFTGYYKKKIIVLSNHFIIFLILGWNETIRS